MYGAIRTYFNTMFSRLTNIYYKFLLWIAIVCIYTYLIWILFIVIIARIFTFMWFVRICLVNISRSWTISFWIINTLFIIIRIDEISTIYLTLITSFFRNNLIKVITIKSTIIIIIVNIHISYWARILTFIRS